MSARALTAERVNAFYGVSQVLFDVAIEVRPGEIVSLLGRNGVGKTTLLHAVANFGPRVEGLIAVGDDSLAGLPSYRIARKGVGLVPAERRIFGELTVLQNLVVAERESANDGRRRSWNRQAAFELFPDLDRLRHRLGWQLSGGEQQMLAIARTLVTNPEFVLLDEPSQGLAPLLVRRLGECLGTIAEAGVGVVMAEQNVSFALSIASRGYVMEKGQIKLRGSVAEIRRHPDFTNLLTV
jgi:branched-chain amino acid transport system ATP-binding protein